VWSLDRAQPSRPALAAAVLLALAFATTAAKITGTDWMLVGATAAGAAALLGVAAIVPWQRLPLGALLALPIGCDAVIALLRQAQGGSASGYEVLAILPVLFVGRRMRRRHVLAMTVVTAAMFALPIVIAGGPAYPSADWGGVALWVAVSAVIGLGTNRVIVVHASQTRVAAQRARELDRVVAVQTAIATSRFSLDAVMHTVVEEALRLTGAEAAVVEIPDGDVLVSRAVAGSATGHLGMRRSLDSTLSGAALRSQRILVCDDSERDERVDLETCRRVGARSMVVVPLLHDRRAAGVLEIYSSQPAAFGPDHVRMLALLADMVGTAFARAELMGRLQELADSDPLTGLPNRRAWYERAETSLHRARRHDHRVTVLLLDLDDFKDVNDRLGHAAGDRLLREIASRWSAALRDTDTLGRVGGDEFAAVLEHADEAQAAVVVGRLRAALGDGQGFSAGTATWDGLESVDELVARADLDMYAHKRARQTGG
jgi:diguanylate cyclase (GGDEF)-like protein